MSKNMVTASIAAAWLAGGLAVAAQGTDMKPSSSVASQTAPSAITFAGCVQKESAVLKRNPAAGEAGQGDEFVLVQAALSPRPSAGDPAATAAAAPDAPVGTSGSAGTFGKVYRTTGDKEDDLKPYVGQRVEITGAFKNDDDAKAELALGTSGQPVTGDLTTANTPEITVATIRPVPGSCSPIIGR